MEISVLSWKHLFNLITFSLENVADKWQRSNPPNNLAIKSETKAQHQPNSSGTKQLLPIKVLGLDSVTLKAIDEIESKIGNEAVDINSEATFKTFRNRE